MNAPSAVQGRADYAEYMTLGVFGASLFCSAALLFLIEPMFAKALLPLVGGAPAVWNTCVVFYELMLLAGYGYAFWLQRRFSPRVQAGIHFALVLVVLVFLPLQVRAPLPPPTSTTAVLWLLFTLTLSLGIPFLALSATTPLLQSWFGRIEHKRSEDPYFLYAASNAGSLLGLLCYPFVLEPLIGLRAQAWIWAAGYLVLFALLCASGVVLLRSTPAAADQTGAQSSGELLTTARKARWVLLAFIPSSLMLSVTTYLSTVLAPIPLLWVLPLALYLLTLVIAFSGSGDDARITRLQRWAPWFLALLIFVIAAEVARWTGLLILIHVATFFVIALTCHSLLAADRPAKDHLGEYYLWVATGGALGGIFTAVIAPLLFRTVVEYPLVLIVAAYFVRKPPANKEISRTWDFYLPLTLPVLLAVFISLTARPGSNGHPDLLTIGFASAALAAALLFQRPLGFAVSLAGLTLCGTLYSLTVGNRIYVERNFFGINSVVAAASFHLLYHGPTMHGVEDMRGGRQDAPLSYYTRSGPLGQLFRAIAPQLRSGSVAVVGLGVGSSLCFKQNGQNWTIYEIDPAVDYIAHTSRLFRYAADCAPDVPTVLGDARLSLEKAKNNAYDLFILDAYSSDYIPVHLITREALQLYLSKMSAHGVLAFHITNNWFDLQPVLTALANDLGLACFVQHERAIYIVEARNGKLRSDWLVMARRDADLDGITTDQRWERCPPTKFRVWTDDYSSLVTAIPVQFTIGPR